MLDRTGTAPTFTRKLSYDEQNALSPEAFGAYCDWLFAFNEPICRRRELDQRHPNRDWDAMREARNGEDYSVTPPQSGCSR